MAEIKREKWGSRIGFILAASGSAVGLGNIWKFPYVTGANGGGAFVFIYLGCVLVLGLPIMIAELVIGRHTGRDPVGAFKNMMGDSKWKYVGYLGVLSGFFILSFYSVIGGWTLNYIVKSVQGVIGSIDSISSASMIFNEFIQSPGEIIVYHMLFMLMTMTIVIKGINDGIEKWSKLLMPLLLVLLLALIVKGISMKGGMKGVEFLLSPDFSKITLTSVLTAFGHSFFTLSLGMGAMITYGSYLSRNDKIFSSGLYIVGLDTLIAIMAGLAIFPAVFAMGMDPAAGPGLIFNIVPAVFGKMNYGTIFSIIFFVLLLIAALTSAISLLEVVVAHITDEKGWSRKKAVIIFGLVIFVLGIPSALSFGVLSDLKIFFSVNFFDFMDKLTERYMLPLGGFFIALSLGWKYGLHKTAHELDGELKNTLLINIWPFMLKYVSPVVLFIFFIVQVKDGIIQFFESIFQSIP